LLENSINFPGANNCIKGEREREKKNKKHPPRIQLLYIKGETCSITHIAICSRTCKCYSLSASQNRSSTQQGILISIKHGRFIGELDFQFGKTSLKPHLISVSGFLSMHYFYCP